MHELYCTKMSLRAAVKGHIISCFYAVFHYVGAWDKTGARNLNTLYAIAVTNTKHWCVHIQILRQITSLYCTIVQYTLCSWPIPLKTGVANIRSSCMTGSVFSDSPVSSIMPVCVIYCVQRKKFCSYLTQKTTGFPRRSSVALVRFSSFGSRHIHVNVR